MGTIFQITDDVLDKTGTLEVIGKIILVGETESVGDLFDRQGGIQQQPLGGFDFACHQIIIRRRLKIMAELPDQMRLGHGGGLRRDRGGPRGQEPGLRSGPQHGHRLRPRRSGLRLCRDGIFVAGDCRTKAYRQVATAIADGATAALNACRYLDH